MSLLDQHEIESFTKKVEEIGQFTRESYKICQINHVGLFFYRFLRTNCSRTQFGRSTNRGRKYEKSRRIVGNEKE